jgi:hypothetical protein
MKVWDLKNKNCVHTKNNDIYQIINFYNYLFTTNITDSFKIFDINSFKLIYKYDIVNEYLKNGFVFNKS